MVRTQHTRRQSTCYILGTMVLLVMEVGKTPQNGENRTKTVSVVFDLRTHARLKARVHWFLFVLLSVNDPSAGSPTETLLRLLLPLDD